MKVQNYRFIVMVVFSKFITGQRGSQQLLDTDGFTYNLRKDRATSSTTTWRCSKNRSKKCPSFVYFNPADESLTAGPKEHNHPADALVEQKKDLINSLAAGMTPAKKRKTRNHVLYKICGDFLEYDSVLNYMFKVAEYFGHEL